MEEPIPATCLNDFIFCPASIYFHRMFDDKNVRTFQKKEQINGTAAHEAVDSNHYSTSSDVITSLEVYSEKYMLICKIDIYNAKTKTIVERKKKIKRIYDGYVFQLYAQYFCMKEMGYEVQNLQLYSMEDNKKYVVKLPNENLEMFDAFRKVINGIINFNIESFTQSNTEKCKNCIYAPACDKGIAEGDVNA